MPFAPLQSLSTLLKLAPGRKDRIVSEAQARVDLARLDDATFTRLYEERIEPCFHGNEQHRVEARRAPAH